MLASPLMPAPIFSAQSNADEPLHYRPAKDLETFNSLLPAPIEFIEGSSTGTLAVAEGKYEAINMSPKVSRAELPEELAPTPSSPIPTPTKPVHTPVRPTGAKPLTSLHPAPIEVSWPQPLNHGTGLYNNGNTCFMNSALQCLLHTPPLLRILFSHKFDDCVIPSFCMTCSLRQVATRAYTSKNPFSPTPVSNNLQVIAKHMRKGRQEDTHEFLRYAIDALQKSCLAGFPPKLDAKIAETTWVHKLFGGRLRSRVTCRDCGHNSDTFDRILDLSLDILRCDSLKEALRNFVNVEVLKGADKYKCEKCKRHVTAEKRFTIHEAPLVLTVHLKRFSPLGRKISHPLQYDEALSLRPYMSDVSFGPSYSLYGVICHAGGGPHSGHYYAYVKSKEGRWLEMNDESVTTSSVPINKKTAYMLFYVQNKGQGLEAAVKAPLSTVNGPPMKNGLAAGMKKKVQKPKETEDEDTGVRVDAKFIGPLLPSAEITPVTTSPPPSSPVDPHAASLKAKIDAAKKQVTKALADLDDYDSDNNSDKEEKDNARKAPEKSKEGEDEMQAMDIDVKGKKKEESGKMAENESVRQPSPPPASRLVRRPPAIPSTAIPGVNFYGAFGKIKKRKISDMDLDGLISKGFPSSPLQSRTNGYVTSNPYNRAITKKKRMGI